MLIPRSHGSHQVKSARAGPPGGVCRGRELSSRVPYRRLRRWLLTTESWKTGCPLRSRLVGTGVRPLDPTILLLLVEDEALIRTMLEETLLDEGFELVIAKNGPEAMAELEADAARFRGIVTDITLGEGPDGWEVARHARELAPTLPVVYMSGASAADWAAHGVPKSVMVPKPFVVAQIITAITTLMNEANAS